jgi:2-methylisocitrate lyase-like PEP mutase family enzyme
MDPRKQLRKHLAETPYLVVPGAFDPLTARLVELAGFDGVYLTGGGFSRSNGFPDMGLMTMLEITHWVGLVCDAVSIPVIADADSGYGNAINVIRTIREFEKTGVSAIHLEDQVAPKKCGHYEGKQLVPVEEMVGKIKAAVDTRRDPDFVIIARTDSRAVEGLDSAIDRMNRYVEAGADVAFVEAPQSAEELAKIPRQVKGPNLVNVFKGGKTPVLPRQQFQDMGFRIGIYPNQTHRAAIFAAKEVLRILKEDGDTESYEERMASWMDREDAVNTAWWNEREKQYLNLD